MLEKKIQIIFVFMFWGMILIPLMGINNEERISLSEKRKLSEFPLIYTSEGDINKEFSREFEAWINDNIGMRENILSANAKILYYLFNILPNNSDMFLGENGELNYATSEMLRDYSHLNLKSEEELDAIAKGFQQGYEYLESRGTQMYYFQCWDKHSIYPEYFPDTIMQYGSISKTDQIVDTLTKKTDICVISPKQELIDNKEIYDTYSVWGDPTHWTQRGAFIGYQKLIKEINKKNKGKYRELKESDYNITKIDMGQTIQEVIHKECLLENFEIKSPNAKITNDKLTLYSAGHQFYTNENVDNDTRVLIMGDSYVDSFLLDDLAESFYETILLWGDYIVDFENIIREYQPDIVIIENAERCDRTGVIASTMRLLKISEF